MNRETFVSYLKDPQLLNSGSIQGLTDLLNDFPYCQSARLLLTLNFYKEKHFRFDEELKTTAVFANSRKILRKHINRMDKPATRVVLPDEHVEEVQEEIPEKVTKPVSTIKSATETLKDDIEKDKAIPSVDELIDEFIKNEPGMPRPGATFFDPVEASKVSIVDEENIVSETLANIYSDQGNYEKAINIYKKLSLKFPEKSSYFAALILKAEEEIKK